MARTRITGSSTSRRRPPATSSGRSSRWGVASSALGTPDPLVTVYGSARVDYHAANRSIVTFEGGAAQEENPVFMAGTGRTQARRLVRPWVRLAWDAGGSGVSAWYSGLALPQGQVRLISGAPIYASDAAFHLEGRTSHRFAREAGRVVVGAS